jgi:hypothetical protein
MKLNILVSWIETICAPQLSLQVVKLDGPQQKRYMKVFSVLPEMTTPPQEECLIRPIICTSIKPQLPDARPFWATLRTHIKYKGSVGYLIVQFFLALPCVIFAGCFFDMP